MISNKINILDLFALLIVLGIIICCFSNKDIQYSLLKNFIPIMMAFGGIRFFYWLTPRRVSVALLIVFMILCLIETCLGVFQLFGLRESNNYLYVLTGTFDNPGPLGGFLAICICLFVAFIIKNGNTIKSGMASRLFRGIVMVVAAMALILIPSTQSRSAILALGSSMTLLVLGTDNIRTRLKPVLKKYGLWILIGLVIVGTCAYLLKKPSADGRLFIDRICLKTISSNGIKGAGIGHFGGAYGEAQADFFKRQIGNNGKDNLDWEAINEHDRLTAECPDNAFNEYMFVCVEAGPLTLLAFLGIIVFAVALSWKRGTIWCYGLVAFSVFALFSYPLHVPLLRLSFVVILTACVSDMGQAISDRNFSIATVIIILPIIALLVTVFLKKPEMDEYRHAKRVWKRVEYWHNSEYYDCILEDCEKIYPYLKNDHHFLFVYGQSLNKMGHYAQSDPILKNGTEISSDPMFWAVMGNNSLEQKKFREAEERYKHAFYMVPNRMYPLYLLAKLYYIENDTARFIDMANKVESFIPKVESRNTERLRNEIAELKTDLIINSKQND